MKLKNIIFIIVSFIYISSCADYKIKSTKIIKEKNYYSSNGFALIHDDKISKENIIKKRINNESLQVIHRNLKKNTPIKIINPENSKFVETKIFWKGDYPNIFSVVISSKIATILELDINNPYVEVVETKKNKTFIAKESNTFDEEKNVAEKAPVEAIMMDDLSSNQEQTKKNISTNYNFILVINDFYFEDSAINLKNELIKKTKMDNISVKKINNKKYRLLIGPFKNFNALKTTYISLNNLGFDDLNIYKN